MEPSELLGFVGRHKALFLFAVIFFLVAFYSGYFEIIGDEFAGLIGIYGVITGTGELFGISIIFIWFFIWLLEKFINSIYSYNRFSKWMEVFDWIPISIANLIFAFMIIFSGGPHGNIGKIIFIILLVLLISLTMIFVFLVKIRDGVSVHIIYFFVIVFQVGYLSYKNGELYALMKLHFPTELYEIQLKNKTINHANIINSSEYGILYSLDSKITFIPQSELRFLRLSPKILRKNPQISDETEPLGPLD